MAHPDLLSDIERFLEVTGMAESAFGRSAVNDWAFVRDLRQGRRLFRETEDKVRAFMAEHVAQQVAA